ncbi:MAG TPA: metallophosphoesterase [Gemmataceae bacterium]|nr:metallophosphoesterase [Gemmataceae bacterium]
MTDGPFHVTLCLLLFAGACLGHLATLVFSHNRWYGLALPKHVTHPIQYLHGLLTLAGWFGFWWLWGFDLTAAFRPQPEAPWRYLAAAYLVVCWLVGFVALPAALLARRLRRKPAVLASNHTQTVDYARELGYKPVGRGKKRHLARLPYNQVFQVDFNEKELRLPRLPAALDGLTVLHLSDLHLCGTPDREFYDRVMDRCAAWEADLVALTGDVVDSHHHYRWVTPVLSRLRWKVGAFAVLGNHDWMHEAELARRRLRRARFDVLGNAWKRIEVRGEPLLVIGQEAPWFRPGVDVSGCPAGLFRLCLTHTPDQIGWARRHGIDVLLAGHVHGGQVRLPGVGSVLVPSTYGRRYDCGTFDEPPTVLHVSRGLGGQEPLRYNCRPEATLLVLRRA